MEASAGNEVVQALLDEQAALRRVATLVATAGEPARVFPIVTEEVGRLLARRRPRTWSATATTAPPT